jgi:hypothetical protein
MCLILFTYEVSLSSNLQIFWDHFPFKIVRLCEEWILLQEFIAILASVIDPQCTITSSLWHLNNVLMILILSSIKTNVFQVLLMKLESAMVHLIISFTSTRPKNVWCLWNLHVCGSNFYGNLIFSQFSFSRVPKFQYNFCVLDRSGSLFNTLTWNSTYKNKSHKPWYLKQNCVQIQHWFPAYFDDDIASVNIWCMSAF